MRTNSKKSAPNRVQGESRCGTSTRLANLFSRVDRCEDRDFMGAVWISGCDAPYALTSRQVWVQQARKDPEITRLEHGHV